MKLILENHENNNTKIAAKLNVYPMKTNKFDNWLNHRKIHFNMLINSEHSVQMRIDINACEFENLHKIKRKRVIFLHCFLL